MWTQLTIETDASETDAPGLKTGGKTFSPNATAATKIRGVIAIALGGLLAIAGMALLVVGFSLTRYSPIAAN